MNSPKNKISYNIDIFNPINENIIEHIWEEGDLILNNNYNTVHQREKFYTTEERTLWRTTFQIPELIPLSIKPDTF